MIKIWSFNVIYSMKIRSRLNLNLEMLVFHLRDGKTEVPEKKYLGARMRTNNLHIMLSLESNLGHIDGISSTQ